MRAFNVFTCASNSSIRSSLTLYSVSTAVDGETIIMLIAGRNRRAACRLPGVDPGHRYLEDDPTATS
jgi:hypothetical protein